MKTLKNKICSILAFLLLCSCNNSNESKASDPTQTAITQKKIYKCSNPESNLNCLEEACDYAGGNFSQELKKCSCQIGDYFSVEQNEPKCLKSQIKNTCLQSKNGFMNSNESPEIFNNNCGVFTATDDNNIVIDFSKSNAADRLEFAKWGDTTLSQEFNYNFWHSSDPIMKRIFLGGSITDNSFINGILKPYNHPDENTEYLYNIDLSPLYFSNSTDAIHFLTNNSQKTDVFAAQENLKNTHPVINKLLTIYQSISTNLNYEVESRYKEKCLRSCIARSEKIKVDGGLVWFEKFYTHGVLFRNELRMSDERNLTVATLILADHSISMAIELNRDNTGILLQAIGFDSNGKLLFTKNGLNINEIKNEQLLLKQNISEADIKVGLCEDQISVNEFKEYHLENAIMNGPEKNDFYGWSSSLNPQDFWLTRLNLNTFGTIELGGSSSHATKTASVLINSGKDNLSVGIAPLSISVCLDTQKISMFWKNLMNANIKVLNLSATDEMDRETCQSRMKNHPLLTAPNDALWIAAAGNKPTGQALGCPQHLFGQQNLIVVAANQGSRMHPFSNFGAKIADITAPGEEFEGSGWGTSFSTPRVSRVAAKIFSMYPNLSPFQVKKAVLLGADIPNSPLPVLSKGILNEENSLFIAKGISESINMTDLLKEKFCKKQFSFCSTLNTKLKINNELDLQGRMK